MKLFKPTLDDLELPSQRTKEIKNCSSSERPCSDKTICFTLNISNSIYISVIYNFICDWHFT